MLTIFFIRPYLAIHAFKVEVKNVAQFAPFFFHFCIAFFLLFYCWTCSRPSFICLKYLSVDVNKQITDMNRGRISQNSNCCGLSNNYTNYLKKRWYTKNSGRISQNSNCWGLSNNYTKYHKKEMIYQRGTPKDKQCNTHK
jgi:hypothetical protein